MCAEIGPGALGEAQRQRTSSTDAKLNARIKIRAVHNAGKEKETKNTIDKTSLQKKVKKTISADLFPSSTDGQQLCCLHRHSSLGGPTNHPANHVPAAVIFQERMPTHGCLFVCRRM